MSHVNIYYTKQWKVGRVEFENGSLALHLVSENPSDAIYINLPLLQ